MRVGVFVLNSNDVSTPLQSIGELSGWVEENGTCISFWLSWGNTSCLRPHFEYRLTPVHLILLPLELMWDCLSRKADSRTGNLGGYIQLKRVQYRVFCCSSIKHCKRDLPYHSAADLRKRLMLLCYFLNLQKQHTLHFGQRSSRTAANVVSLNGWFFPVGNSTTTSLAKRQLGGGENFLWWWWFFPNEVRTSREIHQAVSHAFYTHTYIYSIVHVSVSLCVYKKLCCTHTLCIKHHQFQASK